MANDDECNDLLFDEVIAKGKAEGLKASAKELAENVLSTTITPENRNLLEKQMKTAEALEKSAEREEANVEKIKRKREQKFCKMVGSKPREEE